MRPLYLIAFAVLPAGAPAQTADTTLLTVDKWIQARAEADSFSGAVALVSHEEEAVQQSVVQAAVNVERRPKQDCIESTVLGVQTRDENVLGIEYQFPEQDTWTGP